MKKYQQLLLAVCVCAIGTLNAQQLVGSFLYNDSDPDLTDVQAGTLNARTLGGNPNTRGQVSGTIGVYGSGDASTSGYSGANTRNFSFISHYTSLNRFSGSDGGLVFFDYDLSAYIAANPAGTNPGEYRYDVTIDFTNRRTGSGIHDGLFYVSANTASLTLDTTAATDIGPSGDTETLVGDTAKYTLLGTIVSGTGSGTATYDFTSIVAASNDGLIRIAYYDESFSAAINFRNASGITATAVVPEASTYALLAGLLGYGYVILRRRC